MKTINNLLNITNSEDLFFIAIIAVFYCFMAIGVVRGF